MCTAAYYHLIANGINLSLKCLVVSLQDLYGCYAPAQLLCWYGTLLGDNATIDLTSITIEFVNLMSSRELLGAVLNEVLEQVPASSTGNTLS